MLLAPSFTSTHIRSSSLSLDQQALSSHLLWHGETHGRENGRGNIAKNAAILLQTPTFGVVGHDERHLVGCVRCLGLAVRELHLLSVSMICCDEEDVTLL